MAEPLGPARAGVREARHQAAARHLGQRVLRARLDVCERVQRLRAAVVAILVHCNITNQPGV